MVNGSLAAPFIDAVLGRIGAHGYWPAALPPAPMAHSDSKEGKRPRVCKPPGTVQFHQTARIALREQVRERSNGDRKRQA